LLKSPERAELKTAALLIAAAIILLFLPAVITSLDDFRLESQIDPFSVTTASATTSAVTLSQDLYNDDTVNVDSVSSNYTLDNPIASSYASATNALTVSGLSANVTRTLTVTYEIDALTDYTGAGTATKVVPVLMILGVLCIVGGAGYNAFSRRGD